jgi:predicted outer membrane repeat protein
MIFYNQSSPTIKGNIITNNQAVRYSGGIEFWSLCSPTIIDNLIANNSVAQYHGGGILMSTDCSGTITGNTISGNSAAGFGGGIYCEKKSSPTVSNNIISANLSNKSGAGICCKENCLPILTYNTITNNTATKYGGGIQFDNSSLLIAYNIISGNTCDLDGGGISTSKESSIIINNIISGNKADHGGGYDGWYCSPTMTNNTFYGNIAATSGGAISCTKSSSMTFVNTILWNNDAPAGPEIWIGEPASPSTVTISYSDVDGGKASVLVDQNCIFNWGPGMINANPLFVDAVNGDFHLTCPSPCKDTGDNSYVTELTDFEGDTRIAYGTVDMGADEFYTHLYWTGNATPGGNVELKFVGLPGTAPVGLFIGSGVLDPPMHSMWGDWYLAWPWFGPIDLGAMPAPNGLLVLNGTLPSTPPGPYTIYMQAIIGTELTNLGIMKIE